MRQVPTYRSEGAKITTPSDVEPSRTDKTSDGSPAGYDAFLSYSHAADGRLAPAVQRGLHRLAKRWYQLRALRVFRDQTSLAVNPDLWTTITDALGVSRFFVLMASPEAASSPWVDKEVAYWAEHRERETFLIVLTGGTIAWDADAGDFDWTRTDALPPRLRGWFAAEPLWVDLSWAREETQLSVRHSRFRAGLATLAAPIHGRDRDELDGEDVHQHRVATRLRRIGVGALALLLAVAVVLGGVATWLRQQTVEQRDQALSRELAARSEAIGDSDPELARLLSLAATRVSPTAEAHASMLIAAARPGVGTIATGDDSVDSLAFSPDGSLLATTGPRGRVRLWDLASRRTTGELDADAQRAVAFSPDSRTIATVGGDGQVRFWDAGTRQQSGTAEPGDPAHTAQTPAPSLAFSPDGRTVAAGSPDGGVQLWDVATRTRAGAPLTGHRHPAMAFSPDGAVLATAGNDGAVRFWDVGTRGQVGDTATAHVPDEAARVGPSASFSPDGRTVAVASIDGTTRFWDVATRQQAGAPLTGYTRPERVTLRPSVAFSADGRTLATGSHDGTVSLWNAARRERIGEPLVGHTRPVGAVAFGPDGRTLATGAQDGTVRLWDVGGHHQDSNPLTDFTGPVYSVAFSPDGRTLAAGGDNGAAVTPHGSPLVCGHDGWAVCGDAGRMRKVMGGYLAHYDLGASPPQRQLGPIAVWWDVDKRERLAALGSPDTSPILSVAFSPDGRTLALGGLYLGGDDNGKSVLWDLAGNRRIGEPLIEPGTVRSLVFGRDGAVLVSGADGAGEDGVSVRLRDTGTRAETGAFTSDTAVYAVAVSPDGGTVAAGRRDGAVPLWSVETEQQVGVLAAHTGPVGAVAFSPDGRTLVTAGDDGAVRLWDAATRGRVGEPFVGHTGPVYAAAFSPDGGLLATGSSDGSVRLWDVATRKQVSDPHLRHHGPVRSVAFDPDGSTLASGGEDHAVRLWEVGYARDVEASLCASLHRSLTPEEWARHVPDLPQRRLCP